MKITKTFEIGISGKYQTYRFGTSLEVVADSMNIETAEESLSRAAIDSTFEDLRAFSISDEDFRTVLAARDEELQKYRKLLSNQGKTV